MLFQLEGCTWHC